MTTQAIGANGEETAARFLISRGYAILDRNFRTRYGELDIVAQDGVQIVFVEVKTRKNADFANAAEAVTPSKRRKLRHVALHWLTLRNSEAAARFDVIEVYKNGDINHITNAFE